MQDAIASLMPPRQGHFRLESGHHSDLWLDVELLCLRPEPVHRLTDRLADQLAAHQVDVICGPLVEGAFVALMVAAKLGVSFAYSERFMRPPSDGLFPVLYRLPPAMRSAVRGKRVAIVDDVINAGSAVGGTLHDLISCEAQPIAIAALVTLGETASTFAAAKGLALETLATFPNAIWAPGECPLCADGTPIEDLLMARA